MIGGTAEPWDGDGGYYITALFGAGVLLGLFLPRALGVHYCGALLGQFTYMVIFVGAGPLIAIGAVFLAGYTLVLLLGALGSAKVRTGFLDIKFGRHDDN